MVAGFLVGEDFKRLGQQPIAGKHSGCFIKLYMGRWLTSPEVVIVHARKVVMYKRIGMHHFHGGRDAETLLASDRK